VQKNAKWKTLKDLIDDARANPGEITFSVSDLQSNNYTDLLAIEEAADVEFKIIGYDGGGPARTALVAGEVDATDAAMFGALAIASETRVLAVSAPKNEWSTELTDGAPTVSEELGVELPESSANYVMFAPKKCASDYKERYEELVDGLSAALEDSDYLANLKKLGQEEAVAYLTPDELQKLSETSENQISAILEKNPDAFTS
jgi:tripartite-type tricarboxylate transporter receptor subunit TctC